MDTVIVYFAQLPKRTAVKPWTVARSSEVRESQ